MSEEVVEFSELEGEDPEAESSGEDSDLGKMTIMIMIQILEHQAAIKKKLQTQAALKKKLLTQKPAIVLEGNNDHHDHDCHFFSVEPGESSDLTSDVEELVDQPPKPGI